MMEINGVINVYKEKGYTSHDVVAVVRKYLRIYAAEHGKIKVGHTGTLDPQAEGVLPICVGRATKLAGDLTAQNKSYRAQLILGLTTDTGDHTGQTLTSCKVDVSPDALSEAINHFVGGYMQTPPMYSAIKIGGKKLYELARQGKSVEREPRHVEIFSIKMIEENMSDNRMWLDIDCGKGTYIRSLCEDIGKRLNCGGCMGDLIRTKSGMLTVDNTLRLHEIEQIMKDGRWDFLINPKDMYVS